MAATNSSSQLTEPFHVQGKDELRTVVEGHSVVLVDFYADWCAPCKQLEPIVESIAAETNATVTKVDVDTNQQLVAAHAIHVVPTIELYRDGERVDQLIGVQSEAQLRDLIRRNES